MEVGKRIARIRKENKLSQEKFAEKYYVTQQTVSHWENGRSYPDLATLVKISDDFNVSLDELMKGDRDMVRSIVRSVKLEKYYKRALIAVIGIAVIASALLGFRYVSYRNVSSAAAEKYEAGLEKYGFERFSNGWDHDYETYIDDIQYVADEPEMREFSEDSWGIRNQGVYAVIDPEGKLKVSAGTDERETPYHIVLRLFYDRVSLDVYEDDPGNEEMYYRFYEGHAGSYDSYDGEGFVPEEMDPVIRNIYEENKETIDRVYRQAMEIRDTIY